MRFCQSSSWPKGYNQCQTRSVSAPAIEQAVVDQIRGIAANPTVVEEVVRQLDEQRVAGVEALEREKRVMEKERQRLGASSRAAVTRWPEAMLCCW